MFVLAQKLQILKAKLKVWNKNCFLDMHIRVDVATNNLKHIQESISTDSPIEILTKQ